MLTTLSQMVPVLKEGGVCLRDKFTQPSSNPYAAFVKSLRSLRQILICQLLSLNQFQQRISKQKLVLMIIKSVLSLVQR